MNDRVKRHASWLRVAWFALLVGACSSSASPVEVATPAASPVETPTPAASPARTSTPTVHPTAMPSQEPLPTAAAEPQPSVEPEPDVLENPVPAFPTGALTASQAAKRVGKVAIVCGHVVSARYAKTTNGKPTFLNLDRPYPDPIFTVVIWNEDRPAFDGAPEKSFLNDWACIQGRVEKYGGVAQITSIGGDVMRPASFVPWTKDELDCVRRGTKMGWGCETYLDVQIEIRAAEAELGLEMYWDVMDDLNDYYSDAYSDLYP